MIEDRQDKRGEEAPEGAEQRGQVLVLLRWVLIIAIAYLLLFSGPHEDTRPQVALFVALYLASNVILSRVLGHVSYQSTLEWVVVIIDTLTVTLAISLVQGGSSELFVLYFVVLFLSALSDSVGLVALAAVAISVAHIYTASRFLDLGQLMAQGYILRVPFLFAVGLFFGNLVHNARTQQRLFEERRARALRHEFLSTVSHDLRNPLGVIESLASLLLEGDAGALTAEQTNLVQRIHSSTRQVLNLAGNLIDAERIEAGHFVLRATRSDMGRIVGDAVSLARSASELKGIRLDAAIPSDLPPIEVDVVQIERVLSNLLGNAIKFTPRGGRIQVGVESAENVLRISVRDSGAGINAGALASLGSKHYRAPTAAGIDGNGLGLFIVRTVIDAHGGSMDIQSREGEGTTVTVTLPRRLPAAAHATKLPPRAQTNFDLPAVAESA